MRKIDVLRQLALGNSIAARVMLGWPSIAEVRSPQVAHEPEVSALFRLYDLPDIRT
jgi:hypothetical protein